MTVHGAWRGSALLTLCLAVAACGGSKTEQTATWRTDCPSLERPEPLSLGAARDAERVAARRHELRIQEAAQPGSFLRQMHAALDP